jgi:prepilin peptidase CpaA
VAAVADAGAPKSRIAVSAYQLVAMGIVLVAVVFDVATRRIPNLLTFGAAVAAVLVHGYSSGLAGAGLALAGWLVGAALFFPIFALGGMGAGDVKLLGALGAWLGPATVLWVGLYSGVAGGVMGLIVAALHGYLGTAFSNIGNLIIYWRVMGPRPAPELTLATHRGPRLAYAVPVLAGLMVALWLR